MKEIFSRRSIRKYKSDSIPRSIIEELIKAAMAAPSSKNRQPWKFLVYSGGAKKSILEAMEKGLYREENVSSLLPESAYGLPDAKNTLRIMKAAPVLIMIFNKLADSPFKPVTNDQRIGEICNTLSIGAAVENLILSATEKGLGTLWVANTCFSYPELTEAIGEEGQLAGCVVLGIPDEAPPPRQRKTLEQTVEFRD